MSQPLIDLIEKITDETTFLQFFRALREECEFECSKLGYHDCAQSGHWESHSTKDFLKSAEERSTGDLKEGVHHAEPMLRRVAWLTLAGEYRARDLAGGR